MSRAVYIGVNIGPSITSHRHILLADLQATTIKAYFYLPIWTLVVQAYKILTKLSANCSGICLQVKTSPSACMAYRPRPITYSYLRSKRLNHSTMKISGVILCSNSHQSGKYQVSISVCSKDTWVKMINPCKRKYRIITGYRPRPTSENNVDLYLFQKHVE